MSEIDELPSWAGKVLKEPQATTGSVPAVPPQEPSNKRLKAVVMTLLGIIVLGAIGAAAYAFFRGSDASEVATDAPATTSPSDAADANGDIAADGESAEEEPAAPSTSSTTATTTAPSTTETTTPDNGTADNSNGEIRHAVFKAGQVFLRGRVPTEEVSAEIETKAAAVVGPENVINEYEIDPTTPAVDSAPLYVEDMVLFEFNSIRVETPFLPILDLGTLLLTQNPNVTITVITRTDAVGSEEANMEVSELRAHAIINYWLKKGIDPSRVIAEPRGEEGASEDDDEETKAMHRRAEFVITGLLD
jgi:outer membrane protein OmpA-like peptidoglycan-associated protein